MADFCEVWLSRGTVLAKLECMLEAREAAREQELKAATDIKRVYRGKVRGNHLPMKWFVAFWCCIFYCIQRLNFLAALRLSTSCRLTKGRRKAVVDCVYERPAKYSRTAYMLICSQCLKYKTIGSRF